MKVIYKSKIAKWFFKKYFGIDKEVFKVDKNTIHFWSDKKKAKRVAEFISLKFSIIRFLKI